MKRTIVLTFSALIAGISFLQSTFADVEPRPFVSNTEEGGFFGSIFGGLLLALGVAGVGYFLLRKQNRQK